MSILLGNERGRARRTLTLAEGACFILFRLEHILPNKAGKNPLHVQLTLLL